MLAVLFFHPFQEDTSSNKNKPETVETTDSYKTEEDIIGRKDRSGREYYDFV